MPPRAIPTRKAALLVLGALLLSAAPPVRADDAGGLLRYAVRAASPSGWGGDAGRSLAAADFDRDGIPDLAVGLAANGDGRTSWGRVRVHPGLPRATATPFGAPVLELDLPFAPDLLAAGDFDRDGVADLVAASRSETTLLWLPGRKDGGFRPTIDLPLPGAPTALAAGFLDVVDGLDDLAVAVDGATGPELLLFRSAEPSFTREPLRLPLEAPATSLALADVTGGRGRDLVAAAGESLLVLRGADRLVRGEIPPTGELDRLAVPFAPVALAAGDFLGAWARNEDRRQLALLGPSGEVAVVHDRRGLGPKGAGWSLRPVAGTPFTAKTAASDGAPALLLPVRQEASATDGLAVHRPGSGLEIVALPAPARGDASLTKSDRETLRPAARRAVRPEPLAAALPATLDGDALTDLVTLDAKGQVDVIVSALSQTFVVTSASLGQDASPGDGVCATAGGACTLPAALAEAKAASGADTIRFAISPDGPTVVPRTIFVDSTLTIDHTVTIEGPNQGGAPIVLDGTGVPLANPVIFVPSPTSGVVLRGITVRFDPGEGNQGGHGVHLQGNGHVLEGCRILGDGGDGRGRALDVEQGGHRIGGSAAGAGNVVGGAPSGTGVLVRASAGTGIQILGNRIGVDRNDTAIPLFEGIHADRSVQIGSSSAGGANVISGNEVGVRLNEADGAFLWGNRIGTSADGTEAVPNDQGIEITGSSDVLVGGAGLGLGNQLSGNHQGLEIDMVLADPKPSSNLTLLGNLVGTDPTGLAPVGNSDGLFLRFIEGVTVGGASASARNVISGNRVSGIVLAFGTTDAVVRGNYIGVGANGVTEVSNDFGVFVRGGGVRLTLGGTEAGTGNVISGNFSGVKLDDLRSETPMEASILGNLIGPAADGTSLGNRGPGIETIEAKGVSIGSHDAPNEIAYNGGDGIVHRAGEGVRISGNSIHDNGDLGIDLSPGFGSDGVTPNDGPLDSDEGPNALFDFPVLDFASTDGNELVVHGERGAVWGVAVELFANATCDPSGHGEADGFLSRTVFSTLTPTILIDVHQPVPAGAWITATATELLSDNTSEISNCVPVVFCDEGVQDRVIEGQVLSGTTRAAACRQITARGGTRVTGDVTFEAGKRIILGDGFSIASGASFRAVVGSP